MRNFYYILFLFLTNCTFLGLIPELNQVTNDPKIEAQILEETNLHPFAIWQGLTTSSTTNIKILAKKMDKIYFKVFENEKEIKTINQERVDAGTTDYAVYKLEISKLSINTNYTFQVFKDLQIIDQRNFQTVDLKSKTAKIGVLSCTHDIYRDIQFKMWNDYLKQDPTYTFMIGDNVYADTLLPSKDKIFNFKHATEPMLWKRYVETFNILSYYRIARLVPTLAIWDDHDYGFNNGDQSYPYKKESLKVFETFYGSRSVPQITEKLAGAGYIFNAFDQRFIFSDGRTFRSEPKKIKQMASKTPDKESESHWGKDQTSKILRSMTIEKPTWIIKGDQFFGKYHTFESFEVNHPNDFKNFLAELKKVKSKAFFVSGDRHLNELMKIDSNETGYETYELTSSAMHAAVFPNAWKKNPNPRQIFGASGVHNYSIVEIKSSSPWQMKVLSYGPKMKILYQQDLNF